MKKGSTIKINVKLIDEGIAENTSKESICDLSQDVEITDSFKQGNFNCVITNINKKYTSLTIDSSSDIKGIPDDYILLDPKLTEKAINDKQVTDYSEESNSNKVPAEFNSKSIDGSSCLTTGTFKINGIFVSELTDDISFRLLLKQPEGLTSSCSAKKSPKNSNGALECLIDSEINEKIVIEQNIIYNEKKEELIIIGSIESSDNIKCLNGLLNAANNKLNKDLSFRQISQFASSGGKTTFFLAAITTKNMSSKETIKLQTYLINGNNKEEKEAICTLKYEVTLSSGQSQKQADFDCVVDGASTDLEIISSNDLSGINDLVEYQKSPKKTDKYWKLKIAQILIK